MVFFQGLSGDFSQVSLKHQSILFYTFSDQIHPLKSQKAPKKFKKKLFLDKFQTVPSSHCLQSSIRYLMICWAQILSLRFFY